MLSSWSWKHIWEFSGALVYRDVKKIIQSDESSFNIFLTSGRMHVWHTLREQYKPECLTPLLRWLSYTVEAFYWHGLILCVPLEWKVNGNQYKVILIAWLYPMMKHFYPNVRGLFQDDHTPNHRAWEFTESFHEYKNVNMLWPSQSPDLK